MSTPISRREFLNALVPSWATKKNFVAAGIGAGVVVAASVVISVLRGIGFLGVLKMAGVGFGLFCVLWIFGWITSVLRSAFKKSPPVVQALVVMIYHFAVGLVLCVLGADAYTRWQSSEDKTGFVIMVGSMLVFGFLSELQRRRADQQPECNAGATSSSTATPPSGVAGP
jgi:asparagine N-glycosylation enzyme membrane subunit Stt3